MIADQKLTGHQFETEADAWAHFDKLASDSGCFQRIHPEVEGELLHPRPGCDHKQTLRIDRILVPAPKLFAAGWRSGFIGVEGKRSGEKIGKAICQSMDYSRAVFRLNPHGFLVMLEWVFLWPLDAQPPGDIGSVMAQHRIGWVKSCGRVPLIFGCGGTNGVTIKSDWTVEVHPLPMGRKEGNRG